ncbi:MAG: glycine betaine/L-proline ABC transporter substrate-binding protein ProX [Ruegeria sp.]|nr:glycine betaine/L-proline ABC transporter substrate-binding protein ProX [Ruegeria sp.]
MKKLSSVLAGGALAAATIFASPVLSSEPGEGVTVHPIGTSTANTVVSTNVVIQGLKELGYDVADYSEATPGIMYVAIGNGDADFTAGYWNPLHEESLARAGDAAVPIGALTTGALQGYLIDEATAQKYDITSLSDLSKPEIAALFDTDGDGKANLTGCNPGWGCEKVIEHHLDEYGLRDFVNHDQGSYFALIANTLARFDEGAPIFYYTWTPQWVSGVLVPGKDSRWLEVPYYSAPDGSEAASKLPDGRDLGFAINTVQIVANKEFVDANPAAAKLFEVASIPIEDINVIMLKIREGEKSPEDLQRHASDWIAANRATFDEWLDAARAAAE